MAFSHMQYLEWIVMFHEDSILNVTVEYKGLDSVTWQVAEEGFTSVTARWSQLAALVPRYQSLWTSLQIWSFVGATDDLSFVLT